MINVDFTVTENKHAESLTLYVFEKGTNHNLIYVRSWYEHRPFLLTKDIHIILGGNNVKQWPDNLLETMGVNYCDNLWRDELVEDIIAECFNDTLTVHFNRMGIAGTAEFNPLGLHMAECVGTTV